MKPYFTVMLLICQLQLLADPIVKTTRGYIRGITEQNSFVFKGIPYAAAPVGDLRFKPPVPRPVWKDTLSCTAFGPIAPQFGDAVKGEEDCLRLNLYTPALKPAKGLPVVVWVHGGSMTTGSGMGRNGHAFSDHDSIVTITINYRLGVFGFLYLGDIGGYEQSGNNGVLDCIMALQWIQDNIAAFGGDPSRVTVMGESAGAKLISTLLRAPAAKGKYNQLVLESGAQQCIRDKTTATLVRQRIMDTLGVKDPRQLLSLPMATLITAQAKVLQGVQGTNYFGPVADGIVITSTMNEKGIRVLLGTNKAEARVFMQMDKRLYTSDRKVLRDWFGKNGDLIPEITDTASAVVTLSRYMYQMATYRLASWLAARHSRVWLYSFEQEDHGQPATHGEELAYIWKTNPPNPSLEQRIHQDWVDFIKGKDLWSVYDKRKLGMIYAENSREEVITGYDDKRFPPGCFSLR